jgi:hypothetical protein
VGVGEFGDDCLRLPGRAPRTCAACSGSACLRISISMVPVEKEIVKTYFGSASGLNCLAYAMPSEYLRKSDLFRRGHRELREERVQEYRC